ncbi:hypothetical protein [Streptomyces sp. NPDC059943]|uniref:hypothetical protein n=1 Tax=Streptomyces sp. NPDC059943 TaxID=3347010 RepID=UPI00365014CA
MNTSSARAEAGTLDVLVMADPGWPTEVATRLEEELADSLRDLAPDVNWRMTVGSSPLGVVEQIDLPHMMQELKERLRGQNLGHRGVPDRPAVPRQGPAGRCDA